MPGALFIGRSTIDLTSLVETFPGPDEKVRALANDVITGGSALNAAVTFAHLGGRPHLATALGSHSLFPDLVKAELRGRGVTPIDICDDPDYSIPVSTVISTRSTSERLIINSSHPECSDVRRWPELNVGFDLIQLDQYEWPFVAAHMDLLRTYSGPIVLDGGTWKDWSPEFLSLTTIPIVSERFHDDGADGFAAQCDALGIRQWAMTHGADGVTFSDNGVRGHLAAPRVVAVDTLGAGDIFHGAFCWYYLESGDFQRALREAAGVAARSCTHYGTRGWLND